MGTQMEHEMETGFMGCAYIYTNTENVALQAPVFRISVFARNSTK